MSEPIVELISECFAFKGIKFGDFVLKTGIHSPVYLDIRFIVSKPKLLRSLSDLMFALMKSSGLSFDLICGVPYTALPIASFISAQNEIPMIMKRKEAKDYGTKQLIEGLYRVGDKVLIIEDIISSGSSVLETALALRSAGLVVTDAIVFIDRQQNGTNNLKTFGLNVHSVTDLKTVLEVLVDNKKINFNEKKVIMEWIGSNALTINDSIVNESQLLSMTQKKTKLLSFEERSQLSTHLLTKKLFELMAKKKSNLCVALDLTDWRQILGMAKKVGPFIVVLKLHIDIVDNFEHKFIEELKAIATDLEFVIFEDRKFSDIGQTVKLQYSRGIYRMSSWAHIVNAHLVSGPAVVDGLRLAIQKETDDQLNRGCLLVASMSSKGNILNSSSAQTAYKWAKQYNDFVIGFISQSRVSADQSFIHMTPGVHIDVSGDGLGQSYITPEEAILKRGADLIIVGRAITGAPDPEQAAQMYKTKAFEAYLNRNNA